MIVDLVKMITEHSIANIIFGQRSHPFSPILDKAFSFSDLYHNRVEISSRAAPGGGLRQLNAYWVPNRGAQLRVHSGNPAPAELIQHLLCISSEVLNGLAMTLP